jgi:hypothetical protein
VTWIDVSLRDDQQIEGACHGPGDTDCLREGERGGSEVADDLNFDRREDSCFRCGERPLLSTPSLPLLIGLWLLF